jgi:hypothetical protein
MEPPFATYLILLQNSPKASISSIVIFFSLPPLSYPYSLSQFVPLGPEHSAIFLSHSKLFYGHFRSALSYFDPLSIALATLTRTHEHVFSFLLACHLLSIPNTLDCTTSLCPLATYPFPSGFLLLYRHLPTDSSLFYLTSPSTTSILSEPIVNLQDLAHVVQVLLSMLCPGRLGNRKSLTGTLETLPRPWQDLPHKLRNLHDPLRNPQYCHFLIDLAFKLIKFPAITCRSPYETNRIPQIGCTAYKPVQPGCQRLPGIPFLPDTFYNFNCALPYDVKLTRSHIKPYLTFTPFLTTPSEINLRPPTSVLDCRKSSKDPIDQTLVKSNTYNTIIPQTNSKKPIKKVFVFAAFKSAASNTRPTSSKDSLLKQQKSTDEIAGAPVSSENFTAPDLSQEKVLSSPYQQTLLHGPCQKAPQFMTITEQRPQSHENSLVALLILMEPVPTTMKDTVPKYQTDWTAANSVIYDNDSEDDEDDDNIFLHIDAQTLEENKQVFTAYKRVGKKVKPVATSFPEDCHVRRSIPKDPLLTLPPLPYHPSEFVPTPRMTKERMDILDVNGQGFLWPEEERLFKQIMLLNKEAIAFEDAERGTLKESYFSPYIVPTVPHTPWEYHNIPIAPGLREKVMEVLKLKIEAGVYERSSSSYRSQWFVVLKKNGKLRIVHDLQPLNKVTIRDAGNLPVVDDFVEGFAGRQCYTVFDLFWGFDA